MRWERRPTCATVASFLIPACISITLHGTSTYSRFKRPDRDLTVSGLSLFAGIPHSAVDPPLGRLGSPNFYLILPQVAHLDGGIRSASWPFLPFANVE